LFKPRDAEVRKKAFALGEGILREIKVACETCRGGERAPSYTKFWPELDGTPLGRDGLVVSVGHKVTQSFH
jgi:hypothetical protein